MYRLRTAGRAAVARASGGLAKFAGRRNHFGSNGSTVLPIFVAVSCIDFAGRSGLAGAPRAAERLCLRTRSSPCRPVSAPDRSPARLASGALLLALLLSGGGRMPKTCPWTACRMARWSMAARIWAKRRCAIWHRTRGFGEETAETALGTHWATPLTDGLAFIDGQLRVGNTDTDFSVNLGGGFRWRNDDFFTGSPRIFGFSFWYDGEDTQARQLLQPARRELRTAGPDGRSAAQRQHSAGRDQARRQRDASRATRCSRATRGPRRRSSTPTCRCGSSTSKSPRGCSI